MKLYLGIAVNLSPGLIHRAAGIGCDSYCAACWKDGEPGIDIKWSCLRGVCGDDCPAGNHDPHCARSVEGRTYAVVPTRLVHTEHDVTNVKRNVNDVTMRVMDVIEYEVKIDVRRKYV